MRIISLLLIVHSLFIIFSCVSFAKTYELNLGEGKVDLSGYIQTLFSATEPTQNGFSIARLRFDIWADPSPVWGYLIEADLAASSPLIYGWIDLKTIPWFKMRFGKFYYPFGIEYTTPPSKFDTINPSTTLWNYFGFSRDIGAEVLGGSNGFKYWLSILNGQDNQVADKNDFKDFCGRATYDFGGLMVGASLYSGLTGTDEAFDKMRRGGELSYKNGAFSLKSEFISGLDVSTVESQGWYVMPIYRFNSNWEGLIKYESFDPDNDISGNAQSMITYGINYYFDEDLKLQMNYIRNIEEVEQIKNDTTAFQLQLSF